MTKTEYGDWQRADDFINPSTGKPFKSNNFELIDFQKGNNLVSLKTADTTGKGWLGNLRDHIADLGTREATVAGKKANMILDIRVQPGGKTAASSLIQYGRKYNVTVIVKEFQ